MRNPKLTVYFSVNNVQKNIPTAMGNMHLQHRVLCRWFRKCLLIELVTYVLYIYTYKYHASFKNRFAVL